MAHGAIGTIFKNESSAFTAGCLAEALERVIRTGLELKKRNRLPQRVLESGLEERGAIVVRGIVQTLSASASEDIRGADARRLWRIYWGFRSYGLDITIFELLAEINAKEPSPPTSF